MPQPQWDDFGLVIITFYKVLELNHNPPPHRELYGAFMKFCFTEVTERNSLFPSCSVTETHQRINDGFIGDAEPI